MGSASSQMHGVFEAVSSAQLDLFPSGVLRTSLEDLVSMNGVLSVGEAPFRVLVL